MNKDKHTPPFSDVLRGKTALDELKQPQALKEVILFLVSELLINQYNGTPNRLTDKELFEVGLQARVVTQYYGTGDDIQQMLNVIDYLANDVWTKMYGKPCIQFDYKISTKLQELQKT